MSNYRMRIFVSIFLISIKSYSSFFLLLFPEENVMEMGKNAISALCAVHNSMYLPGSTQALWSSSLAIYIPCLRGWRGIFSASRAVCNSKET